MGDIIDVSRYQGSIDWSKVPFDTAIIRVGYRGSETGGICQDPFADRNLNGARRYKKKVGAYFFSQAMTIAEAKEEADFACDHAGKLDLPLYIDSEYANTRHSGRADKLSKDARTVVVMAFCTRVMERGYQPGVYASESWYKSMLDTPKLLNYHIWVAKYSSKKPSYPPKWEFWQYTSMGSCAGISGRIDLSRPFAEEEITPQKAILIGQASIGEDGKILNNKPGNQTGRELNVRDYYLSKKGWRAFRAPTAYASSLIAYAMLRAVKNLNIGYDQGVKDRNSLYVAAQKYGFDPGLVKVDVECDCSALVRVCCAHAKIMLPNFSTANEAAVLLQAGFTEITFDYATGAGLQVGDILVTKTQGHTCVVTQA